MHRLKKCMFQPSVSFGYYRSMAEQWIIRVENREYGPADLPTLHQWKEEGRLLPQNPARRVDADLWTIAAEIPDLFESAPPVQIEPQISFAQILVQTVRIYGKGFAQFLALALLVFVPWMCGQLSGALIETGANEALDLRTAAAAAFTMCMFVLRIALWPIYIAGIQILVANFCSGRRIRFFAALNKAVKFWPRVAGLCILVYVAFGLLVVLQLGIMVMLAADGSSLLSMLAALVLLLFLVWVFGRFFINVLFWQQAAVLEGADAIESLRRSKQLARSGRSLPWFQRPLWRGAFIVSIWSAFVFALEVGPAWPSLQQYFHAFTSSQDPQAIMEALKAAPQSHGMVLFTFSAAFLQAILRPLLGIAFVLLYVDSKANLPG